MSVQVADFFEKVWRMAIENKEVATSEKVQLGMYYDTFQGFLAEGKALMEVQGKKKEKAKAKADAKARKEAQEAVGNIKQFPTKDDDEG